ncbi:hypothetical protein P389DRAFT_175007 [Cystobasidium minutum MCA 4210]|uniref:uncharacterized protein n=1 Tax=Cystobasidium minutum MCA 4210 TaxID=1397322 RepID=UPI0034CF58E4|eukprot:jgi/Rhomi1/175007/fgenesh1_kg.9_\
MHPRNIYSTPPDFSQLAEAVPSLKPFIKFNKHGGPTIDFKDPEALRILTKALLLRDFDRDVYLPEDRLCPPVAGRLDYILYLQDVVRHHRQTLADFGESSASTDIVGLDIGVGASAIYPLLFTAIDDNVRMEGTDVNSDSLQDAYRNVQHNGATDRITLLQTAPEDDFFAAALRTTPHLDFTMCNPPFYASDEEMQRLTEDKDLPPHATCTGAPNEMVTAGGEEAFVARMITESRGHGTRVSWFSSLLGKASSIICLVKELAQAGCNNYGLIESSPSHTHRWILLWSWTNARLPDDLARNLPQSSALTKSLPLSNVLSYTCKAGTNLEAAGLALSAFLSSLDLQVTVIELGAHTNISRVKATYASWTRAARRGHARRDPQSVPMEKSLLLGCDLSFATPTTSEPGQIVFQATWRRGLDRQAFESFFSTCVRKLAIVPSH